MSTPTAVAIMLCLLCASAPTFASDASAPTRILLLTKSAGFEHSVIKHDESGSSHVERILTPLVKEMGATITCTKDASMINAEALQAYDVVIFYTSGDLLTEGTDGQVHFQYGVCEPS